MTQNLSGLVDSLIREASPDPGSKRLRLPPERDLVATLGASRGALRDQLLKLELMGFLDRTQGRGTYLATPDAGFISLQFHLAQQLGSISHAQFSDAREMLEMAIVEEAAIRSTPDQVTELRDLVDQMVDATHRGDVEAAITLDYDFHQKLVAIVDNPVYNIFHQGLQQVLREVVAARRKAALARAESTENFQTDLVHYEIVDALEAGNIDMARTAMRRHFQISTLSTPPQP